ncbi:MAG: NAD(P)-dependent oxidoreductase [archaeon]|nr:NAD(P)-dependent oxidoreductase [archaeon]
MKLFITGAEGFIGRELVSQCEKLGIEIIGVDFVESNKPNHYKADIRSKEILNLIPEDVDAVIHLAGLTRDPDCKDNAYNCFDYNIMGTLNLIEASQKKKAKQFIFASSEWVYGDCKDGLKTEDSLINLSSLNSEYAFSKLVAENNLRQKYQYNFCPVTILRFGIVYGNRTGNFSAVESVFNNIRTKEEITVGSLNTGRCFIHVSDIANGIIKSIGLDGFNILNLEGDKLITLSEIIKTSEKILNKTVKVIESSPEKESIRNISNEKAKKMLDWKPEISLEEGLIQLNDFLEKNPI